MTFWEWFLLLVTSPLWAPFALIGIVLAVELVGAAIGVLLIAVIATIEACRK